MPLPQPLSLNVMKFHRFRLILKLLYRLLAIGFFCLFANTSELGAVESTIRIIQNGIIKGNLVMKFRADELFNEKVIKFLNRGFTIKIEYNIELWKSRGYWFDKLDSQQNIGYEITFEPIEKSYRCTRTNNGAVIISKSDRQLNRVIQWVTSTDTPVIISPLAQLDETEYYYNIEILIATLTAENIRDLQKWAGEFSQKEEPSSLAKTSFRVVSDFLSSRNHKNISIRSERFFPHQLSVLSK